MAAVVLWVFFLYQIFGPTRYPKGPGDRVTLKNMDRDPNLDRAFLVHRWEDCLLTA